MSRRVPTAEVPAVVESHLRGEERDLLAAVAAAADDADGAADPPGALERLLDAGGVTERLPGVLSRLVAAVGRTPPATPVAAPPYVVVTSAGPLLRATLADGRLVVGLVVFDVSRGPTYERTEGIEIEASIR